MLKNCKNDVLFKTCCSLFTNVVDVLAYKHGWCQEYSMEYSAKHHLVENYFQLYIN
jgi:hypothetical protein